VRLINTSLEQGGAISNLNEDLDAGFAEFINELPPHLNRVRSSLLLFDINF
jgi:hypothetical protein